MLAAISETVPRSDRQVCSLLHAPIRRSATELTDLSGGENARGFSAVRNVAYGRPISTLRLRSGRSGHGGKPSCKVAGIEAARNPVA